MGGLSARSTPLGVVDLINQVVACAAMAGLGVDAQQQVVDTLSAAMHGYGCTSLGCRSCSTRRASRGNCVHPDMTKGVEASAPSSASAPARGLSSTRYVTFVDAAVEHQARTGH